jgi:hypothetical protein
MNRYFTCALSTGSADERAGAVAVPLTRLARHDWQVTGPDEFVTVSAGVIPVLLIAMLTDPTSRQDAQHPVHRVFSSFP